MLFLFKKLNKTNFNVKSLETSKAKAILKGKMVENESIMFPTFKPYMAVSKTI